MNSSLSQRMGDLLEQGEGLVLATVLSHRGSTPRKPGTKMVVRADGGIIGTIGGGVLEAMTIEAAARVFETKKPEVRVFELTENSIGMYCGGRMEILVEFIAASGRSISFFKTLHMMELTETKGFLVVSLEAGNGCTDQVSRCLVVGDGTIRDSLPNPPPGRIVWRQNWAELSMPTVFIQEEQRVLVEPFLSSKTIFLFGGGHISQQVAKLAALVAFRTVVLDDREEYANRERFCDADDVKVISSFETACTGLDIGQNDYLVIVTRGHAYDKTVLAQALKTNAGYIGMLGSRRKRDTICQLLLDEGFTQEDLQRVHCPIGLGIGGETPEEIGVSIIAELIKTRSEQSRT